jgi:hypothetical protein
MGLYFVRAVTNAGFLIIEFMLILSTLKLSGGR